MCAAIKRSRGPSAIALVKDNTRASIIYSIPLVNFSCLLFSNHKKCSEQTNTCLGRDFLFKAFAHCNRFGSLEGIVCSLYGIIQEQSSCFCLCNSQKIRFHSFNLRLLFEQPLPAHELPPTF
jgi:hypothetical protein